MDSAVHPQSNPILEIYGTLKKEQEGTFDELKAKDERWKEFGESIFHEMLTEYIDNLNDKMEDLEGQAFENGASSDEIVMRRAVIRLTKVNLKSIVAKIEQTTKQLGRPTKG